MGTKIASPTPLQPAQPLGTGRKKDAGFCGPAYVPHLMLCFQEEASCVCTLSMHRQGKHLPWPPFWFPTPVLSVIRSISLYARLTFSSVPLRSPSFSEATEGKHPVGPPCSVDVVF